MSSIGRAVVSSIHAPNRRGPWAVLPLMLSTTWRAAGSFSEAMFSNMAVLLAMEASRRQLCAVTNLATPKPQVHAVWPVCAIQKMEQNFTCGY